MSGVNPWNLPPGYISFGCMSNCTDVGKRFFQRVPSKEACNEHHSSLVTIKLLREISQLNKEQDEVSLGITLRETNRDFKDVTHSDVLDYLIAIVEHISKYLQQVIELREQIVDRLHKPFVGDFIQVSSDYHKTVCECLPLIADELAHFSNSLANIQWMYKFNIQDSTLSSNIELVANSLSRLQNYFQAVDKSREIMQKTVGQKQKHSESRTKAS